MTVNINYEVQRQVLEKLNSVIPIRPGDGLFANTKRIIAYNHIAKEYPTSIDDVDTMYNLILEKYK